eukprot:g1384.t1
MCPSGKYQDQEGQGACDACEVGKFCSAGGLVPPTWTAVSSTMRASDGELEKIGGSRSWNDAGAVSTEAFDRSSEPQWVEWVVATSDKRYMMGLSNGDSSLSYTDIDFALYARYDHLKVHEKGGNGVFGDFGAFAVGDKLQVRVQDDTVTYHRNGELLYTSTQTPTFPLLVDTSFDTVGAKVVSVKMGGPATVSTAGTDCPAGYHQPVTGSDSCIACPSGKFQHQVGQTTCNSPAPTSAPTAAHTAPTAAPTTAPTVSPTEAPTNVPAATPTATPTAACPSGYYHQGSAACIMCPSGKYQDQEGQGACDACEVGKFCSAGGLVPPTWTAVSSTMRASDGELEKIGGSRSWNDAGAVSTEAFDRSSEPQWVEWVVATSDKRYMMGLSNGDSSLSYTDIDFALYARYDHLKVHEKGGNGVFGDFGAFAVGDKLQVRVQDDTVTYHRNGELLYTSTQTPTFPLLVDTSFDTVGAKVVSVKMGGPATVSTAGTDCPAGYHQPVTGSDSCIACPSGKFQHQVGQTTQECLACPSGKYTNGMAGQTACIDVPPDVPDPTPFPTPAPTPAPSLAAELVLSGQIVGEELGAVAAGCATFGEYCVALQWSCTRLGVATTHTVTWREHGTSTGTVAGTQIIDGTGAAASTVVKALNGPTSYDFFVSSTDPYTGNTFTSNTFTVITTTTPTISELQATPTLNALSLARFTDTAGAIVVTFTKATDRCGRGSTRFACKELFDTASSKLLGGDDEAAYCQFSSRTSLTAELFSESTVVPDDTLQLLPNAVAALSSSHNAATLEYLGGSKVIERPPNPITPGPLVTGPASIGVCTALILDASQTTGSGGRKMKSTSWSVTCSSCADASKLSSLQNALTGFSGKSLVAVGRDLLEAGQDFEFFVSATNFLDASATSSAFIVTKATVALPEVSIMGGSTRSVFRSEQLRVRASVVLPPPCTPGEIRDSAAMNFEWSFKAIQEGFGVSPDAYLTSITADTQAANAGNADKRVFTIPAGTLVRQDKITYHLTVTAAAKETPDAKNSAKAIITVKASDLIAAVKGGSLRRVGVDKPVVVSAAGSYDPDDPFGRGAGALSFHWSCTTPKTSACIDAVSNQVMVLPQLREITLNDGDGSWLKFNNTYQLTVTVCAKGEDCASVSRAAFASTSIEVGAGSPPEVGISYCALEGTKLICGKPLPSKVNPSDKLVLEAAVTTKDAGDMAFVSTHWSELQDQLSAAPSYFSTPLAGAVGAAQLGLALKSNVLVANGQYTFRFEATNTHTGATGLAQVHVVANAPPTSGAIVAAACATNSTGLCDGDKTGYAAETVFEVSSLYWVDDASDLPLTYSFASLIGEAGVTSAAPSPLGHLSESNRLKAQFPLGNITVIGAVYDRLGASAEGLDKLVVTIKPGVKASVLVEEAESALNNLLEQADGEQVTRTVNMLAALLNSEGGSESDGTSDNSSNTVQGPGTIKADDAAKEKKKQQRASLLNNTVLAKALMEVSPRAIEQQGSTLSILANPAELTADVQHTLVEFSGSLVHGLQQVGLTPTMAAAHAIGNTLSSVLEAGILNITANGTDGKANANMSQPVVGRERAVAASKAVRGMLENLSIVVLGPASAGEEATNIVTPEIQMSSARLSVQGLADKPLAAPAYPGPQASASTSSFQLPPSLLTDMVRYKERVIEVEGGGASTGDWLSLATLDTNVLVFPDSPFLDSDVTADSHVASLTLRADGGKEMMVTNLTTAPIVMTIALAPDVSARIKREVDDNNCTNSYSTSQPSAGDACDVLPACFYYDEAASEWSTDGCTPVGVAADYSSMTCECTHLTSFMGKITSKFRDQASKMGTTLSAVSSLSIEDLRANLHIVLTLLTLWLVYIMLVIISCCGGYEKEERKQAAFEKQMNHKMSGAQ